MQKFKVKDVVTTIKGESPRAGYPVLQIELAPRASRKISVGELLSIVKESVGEKILFTGKPFRQIPVLSQFFKEYDLDKEVIIETTGRVPEHCNRRSYLVPIVSRGFLVISPTLQGIKKGHYRWLNSYRIDNYVWKFKWLGSEQKTISFMKMFFRLVTKKSIYEEIEKNKVIVVPSDVNNIEECKKVWDFCIVYRLRYSGREYRRLWVK